MVPLSCHFLPSPPSDPESDSESCSDLDSGSQSNSGPFLMDLRDDFSMITKSVASK